MSSKFCPVWMKHEAEWTKWAVLRKYWSILFVSVRHHAASLSVRIKILFFENKCYTTPALEPLSWRLQELLKKINCRSLVAESFLVHSLVNNQHGFFCCVALALKQPCSPAAIHQRSRTNTSKKKTPEQLDIHRFHSSHSDGDLEAKTSVPFGTTEPVLQVNRN